MTTIRGAPIGSLEKKWINVGWISNQKLPRGKHQSTSKFYSVPSLIFAPCSYSEKLSMEHEGFGPVGGYCSTLTGLRVACSAPSERSFSTTLTLPAFSSWVPMATPVGSYRSSVYPSVSLHGELHLYPCRLSCTSRWSRAACPRSPLSVSLCLRLHLCAVCANVALRRLIILTSCTDNQHLIIFSVNLRSIGT